MRAPFFPPPTPPPRPRRSPKLPPNIVRQSWLAAFLTLLLLLFRATRTHRILLSLRRESPSNPPHLSSVLHLHHAPVLASLHFFTAPKPFLGPDRYIQLRALESWLALSPRPVITLLGEGEGYAEVVRRYGLRWERGIDASFLGVPLLNSMLHATRRSVGVVTVLLNADIILFDDFPYALRKIRRDFPLGWLAVGARWDVQDVPGDVVGPGRRLDEAVRHLAVDIARQNGTLHTYGGIDLWAWDGEADDLVEGVVPPFVYGRGKYDNWLTHEVIASNRRAVVDLSEACTLVHVRHDHHLVEGGERKLYKTQEFWSTNPRGKFELYVNSYLAAAHGTFANQMGTVLHAPLKLTSCYEHDGFCIFQRVRPHACRCEHSPYVMDAQSDPYTVTDSRVIFCGLLSSNFGEEDADPRKRFALSGRVELGDREEADQDTQNDVVTFGLPLVQNHIFHMINIRTSTNKIFLVVADFSEKMLVMENVCSMRSHGLFPWLMIAALDDDLYQFCITRGLPVFLSEFDESDFKDHANFRELARFQLTFEALRKGKEVYSVEPGVVFTSSPWDYFRANLEHIHVGVLPRPSHTSEISRERSYISSALVYARPSEKSLDLIRKVMEGLQRHRAKAGILLYQLTCADDDERIHDGTRCQAQSEVAMHLFDGEQFRALENGACVGCRRPIVYYSASFGWDSQVAKLVTTLKERKLSRIHTETDSCDYWL